jgi:hypothetical protein
MKKTLKVSIAALSISSLALVSLSGCALLYPNWGTDQNPSTSQSPSASEVSPTPTDSASASAAPTVGIAKFNFIDLSVDSNTGFVSAVVEVTNAAEDGGKCTFVLSSGSVSKTVAVKAEANVSTTQCYPAMLPTAGFPKGKATVSVSYSSAAYEGSTSAGVTIP